MNWFDIVIAVVVLGTTLLGFRLGLLRTAFLFGAFILGIAIGIQVSALLDELLQEIIADKDVRDLVTFTGAFALVFVGVNLIGSIICKAMGFMPFKWIDQCIGGVLGVLTGIVLVGLAIMYLIKTPVSGSEEWLAGSALAPIIKEIVSPIFQQFLEKEPAASFAFLGRMV